MRAPCQEYWVISVVLVICVVLVVQGGQAVTADEVGSTLPHKTLPLAGRLFLVGQTPAFAIEPPEPPPAGGRRPWVWYAPTLPNLPGPEESWMFERFLRSGVAVAGVDVGDTHGSPGGREQFSAFYRHMTVEAGFAPRPVLLARSRGGLQALNWAAENPEQVAGLAGIYPVCDLRSWPGIDEASRAYRMSPKELESQLSDHNPIQRLRSLAQQKVPLFIIHGDTDEVVPLEVNSAELARRYEKLGGTIQLVVPPGQGHNMWSGFFQSQELVDFVVRHLRAP